ncbi:MinD/ParA family protein [Hydrogenimonas cancrithermarum]|uniref:Site-determining protein n=1 Tax=Hydrogenimonas cancrithermarum TaxID=2993563 RepID=A0ABN6WWG4_9BACT|nr:MinD/ParA family protein [Hydrogenimonas cancrithermarum]BDY12532.1 site-determining protein [Hydrogenimonas cancrithermarum]
MSTQASKLEALMDAQQRPAGATRVVAITSGKGGVGKSTLSANIAYVLARKGFKVGIMDADIGLANLDVMFNVRAEKNILHVLKAEATFEEIILPLEENLWLIPGESGDEILKFSDATIVSRFIDEAQMLENLDFLIIDTGAGIGDTIQMFLKAADDVVVVTIPDPAAITDAYAMVKVVSRIKNDILMIINQVKSAKEGLKIFDTIKKVALGNIGDHLELKLLGSVRSDPYVARSVKQRVLVCKELSNIAPAGDIEAIAKALGDKKEHKMLEGQKESGIGIFFKKLLGQF